MSDIVVKDLAKLKVKYSQRAQGAGQAYSDGINTTTKSQSRNAVAAKDRLVAGFNAAVNAGVWEKNLTAAGDDKWKRNSAGKGAQRYGSGAAAAQDDWAEGFQPYADALNSLQLPPRMPRGDPGNQARASAVANALHAKRFGK